MKSLHLRFSLTLCFLILLMAAAPVLAQVCPVNLPQRVTRAIRACKELERNTACYGNGELSAGITPAYDDPDTVFTDSGDQLPIAAFTFIQSGTSPVTAETWGLARLEVQANLLVEQPARSSTLWLLGDAVMQNLVPEIPQITATATGTLNLRALPQPDADIIKQLTLREKVLVNGRTQDNRWLRVLVPRTEIIAWASVEVAELNGDVNTLDVVTPETPFYRPFQIIDLVSGTNDSPCAGVPDSGLLIQTPNDIQEVVFIVNGAKLHLTGTVFMQASPDTALTINVLNGQAVVTNDLESASETIPAGARTEVRDTTPIPAEPYTSADFDDLPLSALPFLFTVPAPLTPDQILIALNPPATPTPVPPEPDLNPRCVRTLLQQSNLRGGPANFYQVVGELREGIRIIPVYQSTDADGYIWWQTRSGGWLRSDFVKSEGDCDTVPVTTALTEPPEYNNIRLEACESDNGPVRSGQEVEITFNDGSFDNYGEARDAVKVAPARIKVGNKRLDVTVSEPFLVSSDPERWYIQFSAYWTAVPGTFKLEGTRRYLALHCNITIPLGR